MERTNNGSTDDDHDHDRLTGVIKTLVVQRGFGFIVRDGDAAEYFFHRSGCDGGTPFETLRQGARVTFLPGSSNKGARAENVRRA